MVSNIMENLPIGQVKQYLSGLQYPINKQGLIEFARSKGASSLIMGILERLPEKQYHNEDEVAQEASRTT